MAVRQGILDQITGLFHGSPRSFTPTKNNPLGEFDMSKMGSGEGVQATGWGSYLASDPNLSRGYRDAVPAIGRESLQTSDEAMAPYLQMYEKLVNNPRATNADYEKAAVLEQILIDGDLQGVMSRGKEFYGEAGWKFLKEDIEPNFKREGSLYQVDLSASDKDILDWDLPISQQNPDVVKKLLTPLTSSDEWKSYISKLPEDAQKLATDMLTGAKPKTPENFDILNSANKDLDHNILYDLPRDYGFSKRDNRFNVFRSDGPSSQEPTGADIYQNLSSMADRADDEVGLGILDEIRTGSSSGDEAASRLLDMLGIKGLRVSDSSTDKPNFVIFNPDTMKIAKKFGVAGTGGGLLTYLGGPTGPQKAEASVVPGGLTMPSATAVREGLDRQRQEEQARGAMSLLELLDPAFLAPQSLGGGVDTMEGYLMSQVQ